MINEVIFTVFAFCSQPDPVYHCDAGYLTDATVAVTAKSTIRSYRTSETGQLTFSIPANGETYKVQLLTNDGKVVKENKFDLPTTFPSNIRRDIKFDVTPVDWKRAGK